MSDPVAIARDLAEDVLFPNASATDRSDLVSLDNLDALADAGLYGLFGPRELGGFAADLVTAGAVVERIASRCLTTALVWLQHHGLVGNLMLRGGPLRDAWLGDLCSGRRRSGIVFAGLLPGPATLHAVQVDGGWRIDGTAPWVSGWGRIDTLQVAARGHDGPLEHGGSPTGFNQETVVTAAIGELDVPGLTASRHELAVLDASGTVRLTFDGVTVDDSQLQHVVPHEPGATNALSLRLNGSLALGVAGRCISLIGATARTAELEAQLDETRSMLDGADDSAIAAARAAASAFAHKAAATLLVHTGSRSMELDNHAQRLAREAMFLMVFGSRPAIRTSLLSLL